MWLMDVFRDGDELVAWIKHKTGHSFKKFRHEHYIYARPCTAITQALTRRGIDYEHVDKPTYDKTTTRVIKIRAPTKGFEQFVQGLERETRHRVPLYNADISPEDDWLYASGLHVGSGVDEQLRRERKELPVLKSMDLELEATNTITRIRADENEFSGPEHTLLQAFLEYFTKQDPDVIRAHRAFRKLPLLDQRLRHHGLDSPLHRYDDQPLTYRGGSTFHSYGQVRYRDYGVRLRGRLLVDTSTAMGDEHPDALLDLCRLSGARYQQLASRSAGSVFQASLVRELIKDGVLVTHKTKPLPPPVDMATMVSEDRAGLQLDARVGIHADVAEIDFTSMFPWLMHAKNISAETITRTDGKQAPGVDVRVRDDIDGYVAQSLRPFLDARLHYKARPSAPNKRRADALKAVLVSANGYLRYREFKLGLSTTHVALCAWVRHHFLQAKKLAEERGFDVLHGLVDSLYIHKEDLDEREVQRLIWDIEKTTGIPMEFEGRYKWIVFLQSVQEDRPVPTKYYGALTNGDVKIRGVEARQASQPPLIRNTQEAIIRHLAQHDKNQVPARIPHAITFAKKALKHLEHASAQELTHTIRISKTHYRTNCPQARALAQARKHGRTIKPGERLRYVHDARGIRLPEHYRSPDTHHYRELLVRSLHSIFKPLGYDKNRVRRLLAGQTSILDYGFMSSYSSVTAYSIGSSPRS